MEKKTDVLSDVDDDYDEDTNDHEEEEHAFIGTRTRLLC